MCLTVILLWFCHHPLNMPDEMNQRQQAITFSKAPPFGIIHRIQKQAHYHLRKNSVMNDIRPGNQHWKCTHETPDTGAKNKCYKPLPISRLSAIRSWLCRSSVLEAWRWHGHNNSGQQTIFSWEEEGKGIESPPIKGTMKLHALRKPSTFHSEEVSWSKGLIGTWDIH